MPNRHELSEQKRNPLSIWIFIFGFAYAFMHVMPTFLTYDVKNHLTTGDLLNLFTPFVIIPIVWKLYFLLREKLPTVSARKLQIVQILLLFSSILYVNGQGMNLSANAIARHLSEMKDSPLYWLDYFFDETLGHIFWHSGMVGISIALLLLAANLQSGFVTWQIFAGALFYSFAYFTDAIEGQTVPLLFPSAVLILGGILYNNKKSSQKFTKNPVKLFFLVGYVFAILLFLIWWIWQGGFPQFSELGWI